jgi:hypothetical protein
MRVRNITTCALGLAAALTLTSDLAAQDTTRLRRPSDQRISISKGEVVAPPRVDTVYVTRYDTVRVDNTIVRVDTVTVATPAPLPVGRILNDWFWGVFAGSTMPTGNIDNVYTNGFHMGGVLGWERPDNFLGFRLDGAINQLGKEQGFWLAQNQGSGTSLIYQLAGDLKVKPLNFGGWAWYALGGFQVNSYKRVATASDAFDDEDGVITPSDNPCDFIVDNECFQNANNDSWNTKWGYNFGTGIDFRIGSQEMFLETRWMAIRKNGANSWYVPISLGVRYF